jgi:hypothetical protein
MEAILLEYSLFVILFSSLLLRTYPGRKTSVTKGKELSRTVEKTRPEYFNEWKAGKNEKENYKHILLRNNIV